MINCNKNDPIRMWKILKEVIKGEQIGLNITENIDFEILENINECNIADKFNLFYVQSIENIVKSIRERKHRANNNNRTLIVIDSIGSMDEFELINVGKLESIIMGLRKKKEFGKE